jgi:predicted nucleic acid-binding protein
VIIVDTGPLVAIADANDQEHERCIVAPPATGEMK